MNAHPIVVRNLAKTFRNGWRKPPVYALQGIDVEVRQGEVVGILGPNGAGKTTFLKIVLGIISPTSGQAHLFGRPSGDPEARRSLGFLPENHRFPLHLSARQMMDIYGRLGEVDRDTRRRRIPELLDLMGLAERSDSRIGSFSKGMMQRLGIAQALLGDPNLLILDEPTDGVDPIGRRQIRDIIQSLRPKATTVLINSHLLSEIELTCDRVVILNKGSIVREGTVSELTSTRGAWRILVQGRIDAPAGVEADHGPAGTRLTVRESSPEDMNRVLDGLRIDGRVIISIEPIRRTLEEGFLDMLDEGRRPEQTSANNPARSDSPANPATPPEARPDARGSSNEATP